MANRYHKTITITEQASQRFWIKVNKATGQGPNGQCWEWQAYRDAAGYGHFRSGKAVYASHRIAYYLHFGVDPGDLEVCHRCDNRACCNPECLFLGTHLENIQDAVQKGRHKSVIGQLVRSRPEIRVRGSKCHASVLNEGQVIEIRRRAASGTVSTSQLARDYKVTWRAIWKIVNRVSWAHI